MIDNAVEMLKIAWQDPVIRITLEGASTMALAGVLTGAVTQILTKNIPPWKNSTLKNANKIAGLPTAVNVGINAIVSGSLNDLYKSPTTLISIAYPIGITLGALATYAGIKLFEGATELANQAIDYVENLGSN